MQNLKAKSINTVKNGKHYPEYVETDYTNGMEQQNCTNEYITNMKQAKLLCNGHTRCTLQQ